MKILLISPNYVLSAIQKLNIYGGALPPLGLLSIASPLIEKGHDVVLLEDILNKHGMDLQEIISVEQPDIIGFSLNSFMYIWTFEFIRETKKEFPNIPIVVGGPHATAVPDELLLNDGIDYIVRGEGEETCLDLISNLEANNDVDNVLGISYRKNGQTIHNPDRPLIANLDSLPFPAYHLLPKSSINNYGFARETRLKPVLTCMTSRGCPFACIFCSVRLATGKAAFWRGHSSDYVINLIDYLVKDFKIKELSLQDDCYTKDNERIDQICDGLIKRGLHKKICWRAGNGTRADTVTEDLLKKMKKAGCYHIGYGIESGNQKILSRNGKGETLKQIRDAIIWTKKVGIRSNGSFIIGLKGDDEKTMQDTIDFAKKIPLDQASFNIMIPIIGSKFYDIVEKKGRFLIHQNSPEYWTGEKGAAFELGECTAELMSRMQRKAYKQFYNRFTYILRQFLTIRSYHDIKYLLQGFFDVLLYIFKK